MAQRDLTQIAGGVLLGVLGAMLVGAFGIPLFGGRETAVTLVAEVIDGKEVCTLGKETTVKAKAGRNLTWKIENYCLSQQPVSVGDFRQAPNPAATNCDAEGSSYPFEPGERTATVGAGERRSDGSIKPGRGDLKLKVKGRNDDGEEMISYYFNICLDRTPADPRLLVER